MSAIERRNNGIYVCPIGGDGKFIRPGETLYGNDNKAWKITAIGPTFCYADEGGRSYRLRAEWLTHERPDSWGRLFDELRDASERSEGFVCAYYGHHDGDTCVDCPNLESGGACEECFALDLIERINRLREADHD